LVSWSEHTMTVCMSHPSLFTTFTKIGKRYSLSQAPKSAANAAEWTRVLWLARSRMEDLGSVIKKKQTHAQLYDVQ
jgi:hypothetical protein